MQRSALCRCRRELSNEYFLAKFGFDIAENEPCKVCLLSLCGEQPESSTRSAKAVHAVWGMARTVLQLLERFDYPPVRLAAQVDRLLIS